MSRKQLFRGMRYILLRRREGLRRALAGELGRFSTWEGLAVGDAVDDALDSDYQTINAQLAEAESRELAAIENALEQMQEGTYGICEHCGHEIPLARIRALPYATTCVACQRHAESQRSARHTDSDWSRLEDPDDRREEVTFDSIELVS